MPLVVDLRRRGASQISRGNVRFLVSGGILTNALDRHTSLGKHALTIFARENGQVREFFRGRSQRDVVAALGCGLFVAEGAMLDRELHFNGSDELRRLGEGAFLEYSGVGG